MQSYILLIIVDNKAETEFINNAMQLAGLACVSAWADTKERVQRILGQMLPDFVLLDLGVSGMNSLDFLEEFKLSGKTRNIPVFLYCNPVADEVRGKALALGASAFIEKTKTTETLSWALKSAIAESDASATGKQ
jgi:CheY-like chemotaxis protein